MKPSPSWKSGRSFLRYAAAAPRPICLAFSPSPSRLRGCSDHDAVCASRRWSAHASHAKSEREPHLPASPTAVRRASAETRSVGLEYQRLLIVVADAGEKVRTRCRASRQLPSLFFRRASDHAVQLAFVGKGGVCQKRFFMSTYVLCRRPTAPHPQPVSTRLACSRGHGASTRVGSATMSASRSPSAPRSASTELLALDSRGPLA